MCSSPVHCLLTQPLYSATEWVVGGLNNYFHCFDSNVALDEDPLIAADGCLLTRARPMERIFSRELTRWRESSHVSSPDGENLLTTLSPDGDNKRAAGWLFL